MKKLLQILAIPLAALAFVAVSGNVSAQSAAQQCGSITISNTAPGSVNQVTCTNDLNIEVTCTNNQTVVIDTNQNAQSGNANNQGNTNGGGASTGDAMNQSDVDTAIQSACAVDEDETPVIPETPEEETPQVQGAAVEQLPNTGGTTGLQIAVIATAVVAGLMALSRIAARLYARSQK